jgi:ribosomal protein S18 acetylase RimI-like enzyme
MNTDFEIKDIINFENAIKIFADAFKDDPMNLLIFKKESNRLEMVEAIYRFVLSCIVPEQGLILKGLEYNGKLVGAVIITEPGNKREWTPFLIEEGKRLGLKTGDGYVKLIREYVQKTFKYRPKMPHFYINELAVSPEFQGKGYGKALMEYAENISGKHLSYRVIALDTSNPENVKFYERLGYEVTKKFRFHGIKGFSMVKKNH